MATIRTIEDLEKLYGEVAPPALVKEIDHISDDYRAFIEKSPFVVVATVGAEGLDCSPRGDVAGFVHVHDAHTVMLPDRRGNNRVDSLRNIVRDPRVALLFLIPGVGNTLRVNGRAHLSVAPDLLKSFEMERKLPRSVIVMQIDEVYFQCARAIVRSDIWNPDKRVDPKSLPSAGDILAEMSANRVGGESYDREWAGRARATLW